MTPRQRQIDECRAQAIRLMNTTQGQQAAVGGYYTLMFQWIYGRIEQGRTPAGIPGKLAEKWGGKPMKDLDNTACTDGQNC